MDTLGEETWHIFVIGYIDLWTDWVLKDYSSRLPQIAELVNIRRVNTRTLRTLYASKIFRAAAVCAGTRTCMRCKCEECDILYKANITEWSICEKNRSKNCTDTEIVTVAKHNIACSQKLIAFEGRVLYACPLLGIFGELKVNSQCKTEFILIEEESERDLWDSFLGTKIFFDQNVFTVIPTNTSITIRKYPFDDGQDILTFCIRIRTNVNEFRQFRESKRRRLDS